MRKRIIEGDDYEIYEDGRIFSLKKNQFLKSFVNDNHGYLQLSLYDGNKKRYKTFLIHRLLGKYFVEGYQDGYVINHINGIKTDNRLDNLEWITQSDNLKDSFLKGRREDDVSAKAVVGTNMKTGEKIYFHSIWKAAHTLKISQGNICLCCQNKRPYASGYYWAYAE